MVISGRFIRHAHPYSWASGSDAKVSAMYELFAVIFHVGENPSAGHYFAVVRPSAASPTEGEALRYCAHTTTYICTQI